jgi:hypothetical protein
MTRLLWYIDIQNVYFEFFLDDTEKPAEAEGGPADGVSAKGGPADGGLADELKAMSLDSGSSTDADVDSDSGKWVFVF